MLLIGAAAFAGGFVYCSFFEWALHRYIMHSERFLKYSFRTHQLQHHGVFRADASYFLGEEHDEDAMEHVTFAWWNAPLLFSLNAPICVLLYFFAGGWASVVGFAAAMGSYYALYEYFHYCMHLPKDRFFERTRFFKFVQLHHRLHHVHYMKNLNVVIPIADFILRTRIALKDQNLFEKLERVRQERLRRGEKLAEETALSAKAARCGGSSSACVTTSSSYCAIPTSWPSAWNNRRTRSA